MASAKQEILNHIVTTLNGIRIASDYYTEIQQVIKGKIVNIGNVPPLWRAGYCAVVFSDQESVPTGTATLQATTSYTIYSAMDNCTSEMFMNFMDDIEASLAKNSSLDGVAHTSYNVIDSYIASIQIFDTEEQDEMLSSGDEQYRVREALLSFVVSYSYHPRMMSGV